MYNYTTYVSVSVLVYSSEINIMKINSLLAIPGKNSKQLTYVTTHTYHDHVCSYT